MIEPLQLALHFALGLVVGAIHAWLLWRAVRRLASPGRAAGGLVGGSLLRVMLVVGALFLVTGGNPPGLVAALAGFTLVRLVTAGRVARIATAGG
jgi:F1F0 ATPase subunit 2